MITQRGPAPDLSPLPLHKLWQDGTSLALAADNGRTDVALLLVEHKAEINTIAQVLL